MTHRTSFLATVILLACFSSTAAQEIVDRPIKFEIGGTHGGRHLLVGGDDNTEVNFNLYTFSGFADWYLTQSGRRRRVRSRPRLGTGHPFSKRTNPGPASALHEHPNWQCPVVPPGE